MEIGETAQHCTLHEGDAERTLRLQFFLLALPLDHVMAVALVTAHAWKTRLD